MSLTETADRSRNVFHARGVSAAAVVRWCLAAFAVAASLMMLGWPLGYDQGVFASVGDIVARGGAPYRDAWDVKGPLVFYMTAAIQLVFGRHAWGLRAVDVGIALLTSAMLWRRLRVVTSEATATTAAALWPLFVAALTYDASAQYDLWIGSGMLGVALVMTRRGGYRPRDLIGSGLIVGLATLTKPIFPVFLVVPGVVILARRRRELGAVARDLALLIAGFALPVAFVLSMLWAQGALRAAWEVHILYNLRVYAPASRDAALAAISPSKLRVRGLVTYLTQARTVALLAPAAAGFAVLWRRQRELAVATATWVLAGVGLVLLQNKFWVYHWGIIDPALLLLAVAGVYGLLAEARPPNARASAAAGLTAAVTAFALWAFTPALDVTHWVLYLTGRESAEAYYGHYAWYGEVNPADERAAAAYIRAHTPAGAPFAHWSIDAALAFLAGRPNVTRFQNKRDLIRTAWHPITQQYRREYLERVRTLRPAYLAIGKGGDLADSVRTAEEAVGREFPELSALLAERYAPAARFGTISVYRMRSEGRPSAVSPGAPPGGPAVHGF